ncbi:MAG: electron transport complex subunit RsxB [Rhodocyclaceae bacterium]|nr:electron transport complex subunit RsxB [Rhodocyclaceae bacterium]
MSSSNTYPVFRLQPVPQTEEERLIAKIDAVLPQTQCTKCGYDGCRPYAAAIAKGEAGINQCPPGGDHGIHVLADLLQREYKPLDTTHGIEQPRTVAFIDEPVCIGCTLCIQACPVDAIVGAAKQMHTIVADLCSGCELCVAPCPVDCISMQPVPAEELARDRADQWREQHDLHLFRLERDKWEKQQKTAGAKAPTSPADAGVAEPPAPASTATSQAGLMPLDAKRALIAAAMERARQQREAIKPQNTEALNDATKAKIAAIEARRAKENND